MRLRQLSNLNETNANEELEWERWLATVDIGNGAAAKMQRGGYEFKDGVISPTLKDSLYVKFKQQERSKLPFPFKNVTTLYFHNACFEDLSELKGEMDAFEFYGAQYSSTIKSFKGLYKGEQLKLKVIRLDSFVALPTTSWSELLKQKLKGGTKVFIQPAGERATGYAAQVDGFVRESFNNATSLFDFQSRLLDEGLEDWF
jgi:hypothetical protein